MQIVNSKSNIDLKDTNHTFITLEKTIENNSSRELSFDLLRILLSLMVVILHVSAGKFLSTDINSNQFVYATIYEVIVRCAVPVFIMLSGYFTLNGEFHLNKTIRKTIHFIMLYVIWALLFGAYNAYNAQKLTPMEVIHSLTDVQYHLWFLPVFAYCQMLSPFAFALKELDQKHRKKWDIFQYFIWIFFIFCILKMSISSILVLNQNNFSNRVLNNFGIYNAANYLYYFMLGYYISTKELKFFNKKIGNFTMIGLFLAGACINAALTVYYSRIYQMPKDTFFSSYHIVVFIQCILVFKLFQSFKMQAISASASKWISKLSKLTFGVYLIHPVFVEKAKTIELIKDLSSLYYIPLVSICIFILCACITWLGMKLPLIKRILS